MDKSKENDSDDDEPMHRVSHFAPANVLPSSNDSDEDAKMMRNTTTNPVGPRNSNNKRRYILEDSDDEWMSIDRIYLEDHSMEKFNCLRNCNRV